MSVAVHNLIDHDETVEILDMTIDRVSLEDIESIVRIDTEVTGETKADYWYGCYARQNADPKSTFLVARHDGAVVGYVIGAIQAWEFGSSPCGWIEAISVSPPYRNAHVATRLFEAAIAYFLSNGIATVRTMLHVDDDSLMPFFRMQGMSAGPYIQLEMHVD